MRSAAFLVLSLPLSLLGCVAPDADGPADDDDDAPTVAPPEAPHGPRKVRVAQPRGWGGADAGGGRGSSPDQPTAVACPDGSTFDGAGCGRWTPIPTACAVVDEAMPDGVATETRCQIAPPLGATAVATSSVDPIGALVELGDGSRIVVREPPGDPFHPGEKAQAWSRNDEGAWRREEDAHGLERPSDAVVLADGRVLAIGCTHRYPCSVGLAEVFDPAERAWTASFTMPAPPANETLLALPDGDALLVGSRGAARLHVAEGTWQVGPREVPHFDDPALSLMPDGRVLVVGGSLWALERYAYLLTLDTLAARWAPAPPIYTFQTRAVRAAGGVLVFGFDTEGTVAEAYTSTPPVKPWRARE